MPLDYVVLNVLKFAYRSLRAKDRFLEGSHKSPYEDFYSKLTETFKHQSQKKLDISVANSEVETFYLGRMSEDEFISMVESRVFSKLNQISLGPLNSLVWDVVSSVPIHTSLSLKIPKVCAQQLWEMFVKLDVNGQQELHIDDVADLILRIFKANGHNESEQNIREWFCEEVYVDFWSFFSALVENYADLLQIFIIQELYEYVTSEVLKQGKMMKKGHVVPNWKERWFVLTPSALTYYESQESMLQKGTITISAHTQVHPMVEIKGHPFRFKVIDGASAVTTEISSPDFQTMRDWINTLKLATRIHKFNGRNFLSRLRLARENSIAEISQSGKLPITRQASSPPIPDYPEKGITVATHRKLAGTKSVPLDLAPRRQLPTPLPELPEPAPRRQLPTPLPEFPEPAPRRQLPNPHSELPEPGPRRQLPAPLPEPPEPSPRRQLPAPLPEPPQLSPRRQLPAPLPEPPEPSPRRQLPAPLPEPPEPSPRRQLLAPLPEPPEPSPRRQLLAPLPEPPEPTPRRQLPAPLPKASAYESTLPSGNATKKPTLQLSDSLDDPPPIPPQRFRPSDDMSTDFLRQMRPRNDKAKLQIRRHSSFDGLQESEILHIQQGSRDYAVVNLKAKKNSVPDRATNLISAGEPASQRSPVDRRSPGDQGSPIGQRSPVDRNSPMGRRSPIGQRSPLGQKSPILPPKQKSLDSGLDQRRSERANGSPRPHRRGEYIRLQFQREDKPPTDLQQGRAGNAPVPLPRDIKTKFPYSTVVFEKEPERDVERAQDLKKKKPPPPLPPKYDSESPRKGMKKFQSDSHMTQQDPKGLANPGSKPVSLPDLLHDEDGLEHAQRNNSSSPASEVLSSSRTNHVQPNGIGGVEDESGYVKVTKQEVPHAPPRVPPRKGLMSLAQESPPPVPTRKIS